ncbi:TRAP transporter small permease [Thermodesulfobacteriota bacterium]
MFTRLNIFKQAFLTFTGRLLRAVEDCFKYAAAILLGGMVALVVIGIVSRLTGIQASGIIQISAFILIAIVFLPLAVVTRTGSHISVQIVSERFSPRVRKIASICSGLLAGAAVILIAVLCWQLFFETLKSGSVTVGSPHIPLWIPQLPIVFGMSLIGIRIVIELIKIFRTPVD